MPNQTQTVKTAQERKAARQERATNRQQRMAALRSSVAVGALKIPEAAAYLGGVSEITVRRLIDRELIKPNRTLRHLLIPISELDRFLAEGQR